MNTVAFSKDILTHFRISLIGAMTEVDAALEERFHHYDR